MKTSFIAMERKPYTTRYPEIYDAEPVIRKFILSRATLMLVAYNASGEETRLKDEFVGIERTPDGTHSLFHISPRLKRQLHAQTLLWPSPSSKETHLFVGFYDPVFYRQTNEGKELLAKVDTQRGQITLYLTYRELHSLMDTHHYTYEWYN